MMFRTGGEEATLLEERGGLANRIRLKGGRLIWEWQVLLVVMICLVMIVKLMWGVMVAGFNVGAMGL